MTKHPLLVLWWDSFACGRRCCRGVEPRRDARPRATVAGPHGHRPPRPPEHRRPPRATRRLGSRSSAEHRSTRSRSTRSPRRPGSRRGCSTTTFRASATSMSRSSATRRTRCWTHRGRPGAGAARAARRRPRPLPRTSRPRSRLRDRAARRDSAGPRVADSSRTCAARWPSGSSSTSLSRRRRRPPPRCGARLGRLRRGREPRLLEHGGLPRDDLRDLLIRALTGAVQMRPPSTTRHGEAANPHNFFFFFFFFFLKKKKKKIMPDALVIVDFQNDFTPGGALAVPDGDAIARAPEPARRLRRLRPRGGHARLAPARPLARSGSRAGRGRCTAWPAARGRSCTRRSTRRRST